MRTALALAALAASTSLLAACPLAPTCGGYEGAGDAVFASAAGDSFVACENGGFAATFADGRTFAGLARGTNIIDPATGALAFDFVYGDARATASSAALGGTYTAVAMTEVSLDHADALCRDLAQQPWFTRAAEAQALPVATAFVSTDASTDPSETATILLCPDGRAQVAFGSDPVDTGSYTAQDAELGILTERFTISGTYANLSGAVADGAMTTYALRGDTVTHWHTVAPASIDLTCAR